MPENICLFVDDLILSVCQKHYHPTPSLGIFLTIKYMKVYEWFLKIHAITFFTLNEIHDDLIHQ